ncbi:MAG: major facilitator superfamily 1 [Gemmatimonadetes bacterium]|nr:major facilitator superfamily 1 [Gemmatimonadota bacterium]
MSRGATRQHAEQPRAPLPRNIYAIAAVSFFTDASSEMIYPLLPVFLSTVLGASASFIGTIEGFAEATAALLKLFSGWWSDRVQKRKPLVVGGYVLASAVRPLIGFATSATQVLLIRVSDRVGKGLRNSPRDALIADSVDPSIRGRAFGFHRASDHAGAVVGPLLAFAMLHWWGVPIRRVFLFAAIPGAIAVLVAIIAIKEVARRDTPTAGAPDLSQPLGASFWRVLGVLVVFTLGNSTDAFLLLRATQLGVPIAMAPILWAALHVVKSSSSTPGGALSDRLGRVPTLVAGWLLYAAVYVGFAFAHVQWQAWALFLTYGIFFGLTEGSERALVSDLVTPERRGTAFGWYYLATGLAALPASIAFGLVWDHAGAHAAFLMGAALAGVAALGLLVAGPKKTTHADGR